MNYSFLSGFMDQMMHRPVWWSKWLHNPPGICALKRLPKNAKVLDVGCYGFRQVEIARLNDRDDLLHFGLDHPRARIPNVPPGFILKRCDVDKEPFPFPDATFDFVVACHVLEHIHDAVRFVEECRRVCKPGGQISLETPSERSLFLPGFPFEHDKFMSTSFFDDPTHVGRPWTSQGLYRLAYSIDLVDIQVSYDWNLFLALGCPILLPVLWISRQPRAFQYLIWKAVGWNVRLLAIRPLQSSKDKPFQYFIPHRT